MRPWKGVKEGLRGASPFRVGPVEGRSEEQLGERKRRNGKKPSDRGPLTKKKELCLQNGRRRSWGKRTMSAGGDDVGKGQGRREREKGEKSRVPHAGGVQLSGKG